MTGKRTQTPSYVGQPLVFSRKLSHNSRIIQQNTATEEEQRWGGQVGGVAAAVDFKELKKEVVEKHETVVKSMLLRCAGPVHRMSSTMLCRIWARRGI
jgi:hypothetical protein